MIAFLDDKLINGQSKKTDVCGHSESASESASEHHSTILKGMGEVQLKSIVNVKASLRGVVSALGRSSNWESLSTKAHQYRPSAQTLGSLGGRA